MADKAFLFDFDGVLVNTEFYYTEFWKRQGMKYFPHIKNFEQVIKGRSLKTIYAEYFSDKPDERKAIREELIEHEKGMVYEYISGAEKFVRACRGIVKTALVTSSSQSKMENVYRALPHLKSFFDLIITAEDVNESKPSPECYLTAAVRLGMKACDCVVFEDSLAGKTVQVADKGLNCARNIYAAVVEAKDGYIFSKSVHGKGLSEKEKQWLLLENDTNVYTDYRDKSGKLLFRLKSCVDTFSYKFKETDPETGEEKETSFCVKEKRIVSYNPSLAQKQKAEIMKMVDKAANYTTYKKMAREDLGDSVKYIRVTNTDQNGKSRKPVIEINQAKIDEDLKYAGYNLLVTSELDMEPLQVYHTYHNLWKIEESFRITKSYLDARPVYVQKKETIYGHFLICYLSLFLLRIVEIKCFKNEINSYDLVNFMRDFKVVDKGDGTYINISQNQSVNEKIKKLTGLTNLDALYLTEKEIENIFEFTMLIDD